jgi:divalent metal cation (Fe/Co/Zn/Cd) transporter
VPGSLVGDVLRRDMFDDLRAGLRISAISSTWTLASSALAIALGLASSSLVLVAFGLTGLLDAAGSLTLVFHYRHALRHEAISARREHVAHRVVSIGLMVTGTATTAESVRRLALHESGHHSGLGAALAAASVAVLSVLATEKRRVARRLLSRALMADSWLSLTGAFLGVVTVAATVISGIQWVDPAGALVIGSAAIAIGALALRRFDE